MERINKFMAFVCCVFYTMILNASMVNDDIIIDPNLNIYSNGKVDRPIVISLPESFKGKMRIALPTIYQDFHYPYLINDKDPQQIVKLDVVIDKSERSCELVPTTTMSDSHWWTLCIPEGFFELIPDYDECWGIQNCSVEELRKLEITGAWKTDGEKWNHQGLFSIIDDDAIDGQIYSSANGAGSYGYYSILYPLLESLGLRGNIAMEGRRVGLSVTPPDLNVNGQIARKLQDVRGWEIMGHSMDCLGEILNNWIVDSISSPLADKIMRENEPGSTPAASVSIYDLKTHRQYHLESTGWVESESHWIKPYAGNYSTKKPAMFNPDFDAQWAWGELADRAHGFGIDMNTFVTHNTSSSHALVREIQKYLKFGFSDLTEPYYNLPPMLSTATRFAVEGTTLPGYKGESDPDNTFNTKHFEIFKSRIDEAAEAGGWVAFNLHAYRKCWKNSLPGKCISEGGTYPDEWVIPILETDEIDDQLNPPVRLGISNWKEWYPCPGTKLEMLYNLLRYALDKGMKNVTASEGFEIMGNKEQEGYYSNSIKIGSDMYGLQSTSSNYPHYIRGANGAIDYFNPLITSEIVKKIEVNFINGLFPINEESEYNAVSTLGIVRKVKSIRDLTKGIWIINGIKIIIH